MKILIIGAALSNHPKRWANAMVKRGHEVMIATRPDQKDELHDISPKVQIRYLKYGGKTYSYFLNVNSIRKIYKEFKPDVVNAHYASGYALLARLARLKPLIISCWGSDIFEYPYINGINKHILIKNLNYANAIASTSHAMANEARKILNDPERKITVTPFGVDVDLFSPAKVENERLVIGIVKYLKPIYDVELLIRAFAIVYSKSTIKPLLHIYGDGPLKNELQLLTKSLGIEDSVYFFGIIPNREVPSVLRKLDVFVNCSKMESFGVAVLEAMACEIPVVVTKTVGYCEIVDDEKNGIILKDRKPETMAVAILRLLNDVELRKKMGINGREKVLKEYNWDNNITIMEDLYKSVCN